MSKFISISRMLLVVVLMTMTGCGNDDIIQNNTENVSNKQSYTQAASAVQTVAQTQTASDGSHQIDISKIDIDLTEMSSDMVYSEVNSMMILPYSYRDKIVKIRGEADTYVDVKTKYKYHTCVIADAITCCPQGLEFELADNIQYPSPGENVTVIGRFVTYRDGDVLYCKLSDAVLQ